LVALTADEWGTRRTRSPTRPPFADRRTGELAHLLFAARAGRMSTAYVNNTVIPMLCRKAGVPAADVRGAIFEPPPTGLLARSKVARRMARAAGTLRCPD
jgi:hypothetical protein